MPLTHGGYRPGSGLKPTGRRIYKIAMKPATMRRLRAIARREKLPCVGALLERTFDPAKHQPSPATGGKAE